MAVKWLLDGGDDCFDWALVVWSGAEGLWWRRELRGLYAPSLQREADGKIVVVEMPDLRPELPAP